MLDRTEIWKLCPIHCGRIKLKICFWSQIYVILSQELGDKWDQKSCGIPLLKASSLEIQNMLDKVDTMPFQALFLTKFDQINSAAYSHNHTIH